MSLTQWIPDPLLAAGPWDLAWWQWIAVPVLALISLLAGGLAVRVVNWASRKVVRRTSTHLDDDLLARLGGPLRLLGVIAVYRLGMPVLELPAIRVPAFNGVLLALFAIALVWGMLRAIDVMIAHSASARWAMRRPASRALVSLLGRISKVVVVVLTAISFMGAIGLPITSLLAGLGIGGIAIAFGAQKTVENLFGAFAIGVDQPLREGDYVRIEGDVTGTVEAVGLRSTRLRTLDRTVVTLPNGRLADMKIETFAARDRIRFATRLGIVYGTSAAQLRQVLDAVDKALRAAPKVVPADVMVKLASLGASSIDLDVAATFATTDYNEFLATREALLFAFLEIVERAGTSFAFPTQTLHVASVPGVTAAAS